MEKHFSRQPHRLEMLRWQVETETETNQCTICPKSAHFVNSIVKCISSVQWCNLMLAFGGKKLLLSLPGSSDIANSTVVHLFLPCRSLALLLCLLPFYFCSYCSANLSSSQKKIAALSVVMTQKRKQLQQVVSSEGKGELFGAPGWWAERPYETEQIPAAALHR